MEETKKRIIVIVSLIILLITIPLTVWFAHQQQTIRQKASELPLNQQVVAYVGQKMITKEDILTQLRVSYGNNSDSLQNSKEYVNAALEAILYKNILEDGAEKNGVVVTSQESNEVKNTVLKTFTASASSSQVSFNSLQQGDITLSTLRDKLEQKVISHKVIDMALLYMPVETSTQQQNDQAKSLFEKIHEGLLQNKQIEQAVQDVVGFDTLKPFLTINTHMILFSTNTWDGVFKDAISSMHKGDISPVLDSQGGTFLVVRVVDDVTTPFTSFDQWYQAQRKNLVILPKQ